MADGHPWRVHDLEITDVRCWDHLSIEIPNGLVVLCGPNGAGKTSIIESLVIATLGVSPRTSQLGELIRASTSVMRVTGTFSQSHSHDMTHHREIGYASGVGRRLSIDGAPVRQLAQWRQPSSVLVFMPEELRAVKGPPAARRRGLDRLLEALVPGFSEHLSNYQEATTQRNALLRRARSTGMDPESAFAWETRMAIHGAMVIGSRRDAIDQLRPRFAFWLEALGGGSGGTLALESSPSDLPDVDNDTSIATLIEQFARLRTRDLAAGLTTTGPHRDDIWIGIGDRDLRRLGSQGEQRTAALALLLAHRDLLRTAGSGPILLLDDVLSELDPDRRRALLTALSGDEQVILTSADPDVSFVDLAAETTIFQVRDGSCHV
jgi:DNA replication and repair protein RecF